MQRKFRAQNSHKQRNESNSLNIDLREFNTVQRHLGLIGKAMKNEFEIELFEILRFQPTIMAKVFSDFNFWLNEQIQRNYYCHPFLAETDLNSNNSFYSEPILNLIHCGNTQTLIGGNESVNKLSKYERRQQIKEIRKTKTIRQLEILVGDVYKAHF